MHSSRSKRTSTRVTIVSKNAETLDGLESYLRGAGVTTTGTRRIDHAARTGTGASAMVFFPDDYDWEGVISAVTQSQRENPHALVLLVTHSPQQFEKVCWPDDETAPLIVPKPAWGWTILDAIRAHGNGALKPDADR